MKPKLIALNLLLAVIVLAIIWQARVRWNEAQTLRRSTLNVTVKPVQAPPVSQVPQPQTPPAVKYEEVAKKNLFSSDRNDDIVVDPPKVEIQKPMPPLPISTGVMKLPSGVKAFMAEKHGEVSHLVKVDDTIGDFKIIALDEQNVTFEWKDKQIKKKIDDLIDRGNDQVVAANSAPAPSAPNLPPPPPASPTAPAQPGDQRGVELTPTSRACKPGDATPAGTVEDGYKKVVTQSIFGPVCRWNKQ